MNKPVRLTIAVGLILSLALLSGCSAIKSYFGDSRDESLEAFDTPAQVLATEAEQLYQEGDYEDSADVFQQLKDRFPYSKFALLADLRLGDAYYKADRYDEAVLAYEDFIRLHPKNEGVPYAMYQIGMVYHDQMLTPDRDPTFARKAMEAFQRLMREYPKNEWAVKAIPRFQESAARAASHDLAVGKFYYNTGNYYAATWRFKRVLTQYPDVGLYDEAINDLNKAQAKLEKQQADEAEEYANLSDEEKKIKDEAKRGNRNVANPFPDEGRREDSF